MNATFLAALVSIPILFNTGCAALTKSQVRAVNDFAKATKDYDTFPGQVITTHGDLRASRIAFQASTLSDGNEAWKRVTNSLGVQAQFGVRAAKADAALEILGTYSTLLQTLSSDQFTDAVDAASENLGKSLSDGISKYNKQFGTKYSSSIGAAAAAGIRGVAGIYLRHKQAKLIKAYVHDAGPIITNMTADVMDMMELYLPPPDGAAFFDSEVEALQTTFTNVVGQAAGRYPASSVFLVVDQVENAETGKKLAQQTIEAAQTFQAAHAKLTEIVSRRATLRDRIEQIETLADEVKKAQKLQKKLRK